MNTMVKELSMDEMQSVNGGNIFMKVLRFAFDALIGDTIANPRGAVNDFNAGREAANRQWGK